MAIMRGDDSSKRPTFIPGVVIIEFYEGTPVEKALDIIETVCGDIECRIYSRFVQVCLPTGTDELQIIKNLKSHTVVKSAEQSIIHYPA